MFQALYLLFGIYNNENLGSLLLEVSLKFVPHLARLGRVHSLGFGNLVESWDDNCFHLLLT